VIIVRGRNYYPQDIEVVVESCPTIRAGCTAAFSIQGNEGTESLIIVAESTAAGQDGRAQTVLGVKEEITRAFGIGADDVRLIPPRTIPKTSSGKIKRQKTKELYLENALAEQNDVTFMEKGEVFLESYLGYAQFYLRKLQDPAEKLHSRVARFLPEALRPKSPKDPTDPVK
jgi:fatty-acyl-CoA synthase